MTNNAQRWRDYVNELEKEAHLNNFMHPRFEAARIALAVELWREYIKEPTCIERIMLRAISKGRGPDDKTNEGDR